MGKRKHSEPEIATDAQGSGPAPREDEPAADAAAVGAPAPDAAEAPDGDGVEEQLPGLEAAVDSMQAELDSLNDRYLRLAAEFDNFRKRTVKERSEVRERAQAEFARELLETLDDLGRVTALEARKVTVHDVIEGIHMVERKLMQELERTGFERVGAAGETFDPNHHEAVATQPASGEAVPGTIGNVLQPGYRLGNVLLRPARVVVVVDGPDA
ncbi:MAG: nucleotide exchange factor GrpE [Gemmatimonadales bacterium]|jgi:molecular chaperone GrpE|nr:nucleotide exchange factor GrpE [Gemmatimonadales bacterium]